MPQMSSAIATPCLALVVPSAALLLAGAGGARAQCAGQWVNVSPQTPPDPRQSAALAYDSDREVVVLFGGFMGGLSVSGETWEWDGEAWRLAATEGPPGRTEHTMAYDPIRKRTILFGGSNLFSLFNDTWEWDGHAWTRVDPSGAIPAARWGAAMTFDAGRGRVLMTCGGTFDHPGGFSDTWAWDGTAWVELPIHGITPRLYVHMTYDESRSECVLYGGSYTGGDNLTDTWVLPSDSDTWVQVNPDAAGGGSVRLAYDTRRARAMMFSHRFTPELVMNVWEWDGEARTWTEIPVAGPSVRNGHALAYDGARGVGVLFGGREAEGSAFLNDTWLWSGPVDAPLIVGSPKSINASEDDAAAFRVLVQFELPPRSG